MEDGRRLAGHAFRGMLLMGWGTGLPLPGDDGRTRPRGAFYAERERLSRCTSRKDADGLLAKVLQSTRVYRSFYSGADRTFPSKYDTMVSISDFT